MENWVLLRGLVREKAHWAGFAERLQAARPAARVTCVDLPGNGVHHRAPTPPSMRAIMEAVRAEALAAATDGPRYVLAVSLGGMVAVEWAHRHPEELAGLVLVSSSLAGVSPLWQRLRPTAWPVLLRSTAARDREERERQILALTTRDGHDGRAPEYAEVQRLRPVSVENALRQLVAAARYRAPSRPRVPALVLCGLGDRLVHPECSRALAERYAAPLAVHPSAGHDLTLDEPTWVLDRVLTWSGSLS